MYLLISGAVIRAFYEEKNCFHPVTSFGLLITIEEKIFWRALLVLQWGLVGTSTTYAFNEFGPIFSGLWLVEFLL
jgi:cobalamin biosynthesis protein CobD/CbiB